MSDEPVVDASDNDSSYDFETPPLSPVDKQTVHASDNDSSDSDFETPPVSPQNSEEQVSDGSQPEHLADEEAADVHQVEIEDAVTHFEDEGPIRHNQCPDSDNESDYCPMVPVKRNHRIQRRGGGGNLYLKQSFSSGVGFKEAVLDYALSTGYNIKQNRWDQTKLEYKCGTVNCQWRVYCSYNKAKNNWEIKIYEDNHTCTSRNGLCHMLTDPIIARLFVDKIRENPDGWKPLKIQAAIKEQFKGIVASRNQCQEARKKALKWIKEEYEDQFAHIRGYCQEIVASNPGSTVQLLTKPGPDGEDIFDRFYVCFATLRRSWKQNCRPLIGVDGTYLRSTLKGQLLVALGRDPDNRIYPIAWAVVDAEDEKSWIWFVRMIQSDLELGNGDGYIIMSDRQKGLINAVQKELPLAEHRKCVRHIYQNLKAKHGKKMEMKPFIFQLAWSYNKTQYDLNLKRLQDYDQDVFDDVMKMNPETWCLAFYKNQGSCCEDVDNNSVESFNNTIVKASEKPVMPMLEMIRRLAMVRISKRSTEACKHHSKFTPYVKKFLDEEHNDASDCKVYACTRGKFEVQHGYNQESVDFTSKTCTCGKWQICGIPCIHCYAVILVNNLDPDDFVSHWFLTSRWRDTYADCINPLRGPGHWASGDVSLVCEDPERKKKSKKDKRIRSKNESPTKKQKKAKKQKTMDQGTAVESQDKPKRIMHCKKCGGGGHNVRTCSKRAKDHGQQGSTQPMSQVDDA